MKCLVAILMILASYFVFSGWQCGPPLNQDPGFDLWCVDDNGQHVLCAWSLDAGEIRRVPTWHRSDYGVEMLDDPTQISQLVTQRVDCFFFEILVDRDDAVSLVLEMDFQDDGVVEYSKSLQNDDFRPIETFITPPTWYESVRFILRKQGSGKAVLAHIRISQGDNTKCIDPPLDLHGRPDGAKCEDSSQCLSGGCESVMQWRPDVSGGEIQACGSCLNADDCPIAEVCGLEAGTENWLYRDCGPVGRHLLGERCLDHPECATGICCQGICSQCGADPDCPAGGVCQPRDWRTLGEEYEYQILPHQCSPGEGKGVPGAPCLKNDDCTSSLCSGAGELKQCFLDGRRCEQDTDCPLWNACLPLGVAGGACQ